MHSGNNQTICRAYKRTYAIGRGESLVFPHMSYTHAPMHWCIALHVRLTLPSSLAAIAYMQENRNALRVTWHCIGCKTIKRSTDEKKGDTGPGKCSGCANERSEPNEHPARKWKENIYHFRIDVVCVCVCATAAAVSYYRLVWIAPRIAGIAWRNVLTLPQHTHTHTTGGVSFSSSQLCSLFTHRTHRTNYTRTILYSRLFCFFGVICMCVTVSRRQRKIIYTYI